MINGIPTRLQDEKKKNIRKEKLNFKICFYQVTNIIMPFIKSGIINNPLNN